MSDIFDHFEEDSFFDAWDRIDEARTAFCEAHEHDPLPMVFQTKDKGQFYRGAVIAPSTRGGECQVTFFDRHGFSSDKHGTKADCLDEMVDRLSNVDILPEPMPMEEFQKLSQSDLFRGTNLRYSMIEDPFEDTLTRRQIDTLLCPQKPDEKHPLSVYGTLYRKTQKKLGIEPLVDYENKTFGENISMKDRQRLTKETLKLARSCLVWQNMSKEDREESIRRGDPAAVDKQYADKAVKLATRQAAPRSI